MKIQSLSVEAVWERLRTGPKGLSNDEAGRRLSEFGSNRIEAVRRSHLVRRLASSFTHFLAVILWIAAGLAFLSEWLDPEKGMAALGGAILGVILINGVFSFFQEYRAERAIGALQKLLPHRVTAFRDGSVATVPAESLVPGDLILLEDGDHVPADCRLIEAFGLRVNASAITGEPEPQSKSAGITDEDEPVRSSNLLLAGSAVVGGEGRGVVFATGMQTEFGKIAHLTQVSGEPLSPLQRQIVHFSRVVALFAASLGVGFFLIGQRLGLSFWENVIFAIGIIVANVPEGLLPTVTLSLAMASQRMARRRALVRHLPSVEALGSATVICTDKTGTLTRNEMAVERVFLDGRFYRPQEMAASREPPLRDNHRRFFETALCCNNVKETTGPDGGIYLGDPMEVALVRFGRTVLSDPIVYPRIDEIPFDSDRMRVSTLHETPKGSVLFTKGALERLIPICGRIQIGSTTEPLNRDGVETLLKAQDEMAAEGLRVLAAAYRLVDRSVTRDALESDLVLCGLFGLEDPPRPEVPEAIAKCREAGIRVIMITGDHPHTALAIARQIGLATSEGPVVISG